MTPLRVAAWVSAGVFLALTAIAYAGADHPPPWGFLMLVTLLAAWSAGLVLFLQPLAGPHSPGGRAWWLLAAYGGVAAAVAGFVLTVLQAVLDPPVASASWIGVAVACAVGACWAVGAGAATRAIARTIARKTRRRSGADAEEVDVR